MDSLSENIRSIHERMTATARKAGRDPAAVQLIAVSKGHDVAAVEQALAAGQNVFGENRVQEAKAKFLTLRAAHPTLELHLIGPLQTNKAEEAVELFDVIQTLDRPNLAAALAKANAKTGRKPRLYIEVNIGREPQKAGIMPEGLTDFVKQCRDEYGLLVNGLMCIPPQNEDPRAAFQQLAALAKTHNLQRVSMGMSADFESAIACGATEVRIGTAIFGPRPPFIEKN